MSTLTTAAYLVSSVLFILSLRGLSHPSTARRGNFLGILGMTIAIVTTLSNPGVLSYKEIGIAFLIGGLIGTSIAVKIQMTALPQLVAAFHSLVGLAAVFVAASAYYNPSAFNIGTVGSIPMGSLIEMSIGTAIGAVTFTGSIIAFGKLQGFVSGNPLVFKGQHFINLLLGLGIIALIVKFCIDQNQELFWLIVFASFVIGVLLIVPIGGADMPVIVSMLNSYSGWAAAGIGFTLSNNLLIITGALVGSSGAILSYIMCKGMNRSLANVIFGAVGLEQDSGGDSSQKQVTIKSYSTEEAAMIFDAAEKVIVVPGYGLAVAQAQHAVREVAELLEEKGKKVLYAIHPVAGRMPGHMNVLLAEANIPYEQLKDLDEINSEFEDLC